MGRKKKVDHVEEPKAPEVVEAVYQIPVCESGEVQNIVTRERFLALPTLETKATAYAMARKFHSDLGKLVRELEVLMTAAAHAARPDPTKVTNIPTEVPGVVVALPSGTEDKRLSKKEIEAFAANLNTTNQQAYAEIIEMEPTIRKAAVSRWRTIPGPVADLILKTYDPQPKSVEIKEK